MAGAYKTQTDLVNETLKNLGVFAAGQAGDPLDVAYVTEKVDPTIRMLAALDICYVGDPNNIPGELFSALADVVAGECASKCGSTADDRRMLTNKGLGGGTPECPEPGTGAGAKILRQINRGRPTYETLRTYSY